MILRFTFFKFKLTRIDEIGNHKNAFFSMPIKMILKILQCQIDIFLPSTLLPFLIKLELNYAHDILKSM